jgi:hypothetical protein
VKEQIFRRITGQREFGKDDQLRSQPIARIGGRFENARDIAFDVAYEEIELGERNADFGIPLLLAPGLRGFCWLAPRAARKRFRHR